MKLQNKLPSMTGIDGTFTVGSIDAYEHFKDVVMRDEYNKECGGAKYLTVHACKEPAHRRRVGYTSRSAPKGKDYLWVYDESDNRRDLYLNLVDGRSKANMPQELFETTIDLIREALDDGFEIIVYCNRGESRSPGIVLLYYIMTNKDFIIDDYDSLESIILWFKDKYYPSIKLGKGMYEVLMDAFIIKKDHKMGDILNTC